MADEISALKTRDEPRLLSSVRSAVTPRFRCPPTPARVAKVPHRRRHRSVQIRHGHPSTKNARSRIVIHSSIRLPSSTNPTHNSTTIDNTETFPSIAELLAAGPHRYKTTLTTNQSLKEWPNDAAHFVPVRSHRPRHQSLSLSRDNAWTNDVRQKRKSSTRSRIHSHGMSAAKTKRLSKSSVGSQHLKTITRFDYPSAISMTDAWSIRMGSADESRRIIDRNKKRKKQRSAPFFYCCPCSPMCLLGLLLATLLLGAVLAILLLEFLPNSKTTARTIRTTTASVLSNGSSTLTTTPTTTLTTTHYVCGPSCVNQTWMSSSNLLAKWQYDGTLLDSVTNANTASANTPTFVTGYLNQALSFGANANQSLVSSPITLTGVSFTIDAWIYPTGFPNLQHHSIVGLCPVSSNYECLFLTIHTNGVSYRLYFGFFNDDSEGTTYVSINEWIHVAFVYDSITSTQSIYFNGVLDSSYITSGPFKANTASVTIGNVPGIDLTSGPNYFQGNIDQLAISDRVKSDCEILEEATFAAHFTFDSGVGLADLGPNSLPSIGQSISFVPTGRFYQAISFNGSNSSYFQVSDLTGLGTSNRPFSISLWIRPRSLSGILVHVSSAASGLGWCIPFLGFAANGSIIAQMFNGIIRAVVGPSISLSSVWSHVVETWSPTHGLRLYVDNVLVASTLAMATSYTASSVPNYVTLANSLSGFSVCYSGLLGAMTPFDGDIDEFRVYSRELTAADVCILYVG